MAKKKEVVNKGELTLEERMLALYQLQLVASKIDNIRTLRGELPLEIEELEDELMGKKTRLEKMEAEVKRLRGFIDESKERIRVTQQMIAKYDAELNEIRNNREYDMISKELENQHLDVKLYEKDIEEDKQRIDHIKETMASLSAETEECTQVLKSKKSELDSIIEETKQEEEQFMKRVHELEELIEPRVLAAFKRTRKSTHNGLAVVSVGNESCLGCYNKIPPQTVIDLQAHRKVIACEYCGRILVDPELAEQAENTLKL